VPHDLENKMLTIEEKLIVALKRLKYASVQSIAECAGLEVWSCKRAIRSMRGKGLMYVYQWSIEDGSLVRVFKLGNQPDAKQPGADEVRQQRMDEQNRNVRPDIAASWIKRKK
jgi:hypothetical protein